MTGLVPVRDQKKQPPLVEVIAKLSLGYLLVSWFNFYFGVLSYILWLLKRESSRSMLQPHVLLLLSYLNLIERNGKEKVCGVLRLAACAQLSSF